MNLSPADLPHFERLQQSLHAGSLPQAQEALLALSAEALELPEVLEARWEIAAQSGHWPEALELAHQLRQSQPQSESGWLYAACSLVELQRIQDAFDLLLQAIPQFPSIPTIPYNLACCAAKLCRRNEAMQWLTKAIETGGRAEIKLLALDDPDLAPLLSEICAL